MIDRDPIPHTSAASCTPEVRRKIEPLLLVFLLSLLTSSPLLAATIKGHVRDSRDHGDIVGADVVLRGTPYGTTTDVKGSFQIKNVPVGHYILEVSEVGYKTATEGIDVREGGATLESHWDLVQSSIQMAEIVVRAREEKDRSTAARLTEKNSDNVVNVLSAQSIAQSTDRTAAEALQRVSGLSLRKTPNNSYVIMRGLGPLYNNTLVNGIPIPSPESKDRFVPLDIFPSALLQRVEVTKSLTPDQPGDAIGGSTDLIFRDAPDHLLLKAYMSSGSTDYLRDNTFTSFNTQQVKEKDPDQAAGVVSPSNPTHLNGSRVAVTQNDFTRGNLVFSKKQAPLNRNVALILGNRFLDKRMGIIASVSRQDIYDGYNTSQYSLTSTINSQYRPFLHSRDSLSYSTYTQRTGVFAKSDYILNASNSISVSVLFMKQHVEEALHSLTVNVDGSRGAADLQYQDQSALRTQRIQSYEVKGQNTLGSTTKLTWIANYSDALQDRPDEAQINTTKNYDQYGNIEPQTGLKKIFRTWRKNDDKQYLGQADLTIRPRSWAHLSLKAGALYRHLARENYENDYILNPTIINGQTQLWTGIRNADLTPIGGYGNPAFGFQNYNASEKLAAGYLEGIYVWGKLQILGGARLETTHDSYFTLAPASAGENTADIKYLDVLPSLHLRYSLDQRQIVHFSATKSITRPSYFDLVPAKNVGDGVTYTGNPYLHPARAYNFDLRYEFYPTLRDMFSIGTFYKHINGVIEQGINLTIASASTPVQTITYTNASAAAVYGVEMVASKSFGDFRVTGNYTYVKSSVRSVKLAPRLDSKGDPVIPVPTFTQTRPMQGQSPNLFNLNLGYSLDALGFEANLAFNYTGRRLEGVSQTDGSDTYRKARSNLDLSVNQKVYRKATCFVKLKNLLSTADVLVVPSGKYLTHAPLTVQTDRSSLRVEAGMAYSF